MYNKNYPSIGSPALINAIEDELRDQIEAEVREEVMEDYQERFRAFFFGHGDVDEDEYFIGLDPEDEHHLHRAERRAESILEARIEWLVERRLEVAAGRLADNVTLTIYERGQDREVEKIMDEEPLPPLRRIRRRAAFVRRSVRRSLGRKA